MRFRSLFLSSATLLLIPNLAAAWTAAEVKEEVLASLDYPLGLSMIGAVDDATVDVAGEGPFQVTISGGKIKGIALPTLSYAIDAQEDSWTISDAAFAGPVETKVKGVTASVSDIRWSGVWSWDQQDYVSGTFSFGEFSARKDSSYEAVAEGVSMTLGAWDEASGETQGSFKLKPIRFLMDGNADGSELPADVSQSFTWDGITSEATYVSTAPLGLFGSLARLIDGARMGEELLKEENAEARREWALGLVNSMFPPLVSSTDISTLGRQIVSVSAPDFSMDMVQGAAHAQASLSIDNDVARMEAQQSYGDGISYKVKSSDSPMSGEFTLASVVEDIVIDDFNPGKMKQALLDIINSGYEDPAKVDGKAVEALFASLGSLAYAGKLMDIAVVSDVMGPILASSQLDLGLDVGVAKDALRTTTFSLGLADLVTSLPTMFAGIPQDAVPTHANLAVEIDHQSLSNFVEAVGFDAILQAILSDQGPDEFVFAHAVELVETYNAAPGEQRLKLRLKGQDYETTVDAAVQVSLNDPESDLFFDAPFSATAQVAVVGLDSLTARLQKLAGEVENPELQGAIMGGMMGAGMIQNFATRDGDTLRFDIVVDLINGTTVNDIPLGF